MSAHPAVAAVLVTARDEKDGDQAGKVIARAWREGQTAVHAEALLVHVTARVRVNADACSFGYDAARARIFLELLLDLPAAVASRLAKDFLACQATQDPFAPAAAAFRPVGVAGAQTASRGAEWRQCASIGEVLCGVVFHVLT